MRDKLRKNILKFHRERDIKLYKKQRNKVNKMSKTAKENFQSLEEAPSPPPTSIKG
jgi:aminoglycoside phosphotransferase family enzyme